VGNVIWKFFLSSPTAFDTITGYGFSCPSAQFLVKLGAYVTLSM
jgi:hypothetical protein